MRSNVLIRQSPKPPRAIYVARALSARHAHFGVMVWCTKPLSIKAHRVFAVRHWLLIDQRQ
jgi:hypothetical protein